MSFPCPLPPTFTFICVADRSRATSCLLSFLWLPLGCLFYACYRIV